MASFTQPTSGLSLVKSAPKCSPTEGNWPTWTLELSGSSPLPLDTAYWPSGVSTTMASTCLATRALNASVKLWYTLTCLVGWIWLVM